MRDPAKLGLDKYLRNVGTIVSDFVTGVDFNSKYDRNAVTAINLKNFSFNAGTGGTLTLGGTSNGNGLLKIKDASGNLIVQGDNTGLSVFNGKISVSNSLGSNVLDSSGIVSLNSFPTAQVFNGGAGLSTTSTTAVDVTGGALSAFVLSRNAKVLVFLMGYGYNSGAISTNLGNNVELDLFDTFNSGTLANVLFFGATATNVQISGSVTTYTLTTGNELTSRDAVLNMAAGTHTLKLQYFAGAGGTAFLNAFLIGYIILGS